ncbi:MAG TPA: ribosome maturation factor RimM [Thiotrichaceae bacterium]|nr:ribosome maturation factor RimM [Thiotrichaceae bacterium]
MSEETQNEILLLGKISGVFGVKGWVKIFSHTLPIQQIVSYSPLYLRYKSGWQAIEVVKGQKQGKAVVAQLEGIDDRDQAFALIGTEIGIRQDQLPTLQSGSYYWSELQGLTVVNQQQIELGRVDWLFSTGSNDVLVVKGEKEHMVPWIEESVIIAVDQEKKQILVDWDADF